MHYPTWDRVAGKQRMLSAYLYTPKTPGPHPVLISIHGGPEEQYRPGYEAFFQFLGERAGVRGDRAERARLVGLRQDVPEAR